RQRERLLLGERGGVNADERDLEAVENPGDAQRDHNQPVPAAPGQPVEPLRDVRGDGLPGPAELGRRGCCAHVVLLVAVTTCKRGWSASGYAQGNPLHSPARGGVAQLVRAAES